MGHVKVISNHTCPSWLLEVLVIQMYTGHVQLYAGQSRSEIAKVKSQDISLQYPDSQILLKH